MNGSHTKLLISHKFVQRLEIHNQVNFIFLFGDCKLTWKEPSTSDGRQNGFYGTFDEERVYLLLGHWGWRLLDKVQTWKVMNKFDGISIYSLEDPGIWCDLIPKVDVRKRWVVTGGRKASCGSKVVGMPESNTLFRRLRWFDPRLLSFRSACLSLKGRSRSQGDSRPPGTLRHLELLDPTG